MKFFAGSKLVWIGAALVLGCFGRLAGAGAPAGARETGAGEVVNFYIGTYTNTTARGIYRATLNPETGQLSAPELAAEAASPSFLVFDPFSSVLYSVNEVAEYQDQPTGSVSSYAVNRETGELRLVGKASSGGVGPCHLGVGASGQILATANYGDGSVAISALNTNGAISPPLDVVHHAGSGPDPRRQQGPHAHSASFGPSGLLFVADLGLDKVLIYGVDVERVRLEPYSLPFVEVNPGSGPRHVAFHPETGELYVANELSSTVSRFRPLERTGGEVLQVVSTLPEGFQGRNYPAEIAVSPDGRFLYVSNRGHDSIAIFRIEESGLTAIGHAPTGGKNPRHFTFDPSGSFLLVANQDSDNLVLFRVLRETGTLERTGSEISVPRPVSICFTPAAKP